LSSPLSPEVVGGDSSSFDRLAPLERRDHQLQ
jgi:hypothetical protein